MVLEVAIFDVTDADGFEAAYSALASCCSPATVAGRPDDPRDRVTDTVRAAGEWTQ